MVTQTAVAIGQVAIGQSETEVETDWLRSGNMTSARPERSDSNRPRLYQSTTDD